MAITTYFSSTSKEQRWVDQVSKKFIREVSIDISDGNPICVFNIPISITIFKPEAYIPQMIALGPYHHMDQHLYHMERYKIACAKSFFDCRQENFNFRDSLIKKLKQLDAVVRGCYHSYLDLDDNTLSWIMVIDGLFLVNLLKSFFGEIEHENKIFERNAILSRDLLLLENQIPFVVLRQIYKFIKNNSSEKDDDIDQPELVLLLDRFCRANSPLELSSNSRLYYNEKSPLHMLDLMYHLIVNTPETHRSPQDEVNTESQNESDEVEVTEDDINTACDNIGEITKLAMKFGIGTKILKPVQVIQNIPWDKILTFLGLKTAKEYPGRYEGPLVEEIKIPSVSSLHYYAGVTFKSTSEGITDIKFVEDEAVLYLPKITLDVNSEVILRNLVAYETAMNYSTTSFSLSQFVDLMSGIIDDAEDARHLKEKGIIEGDLTNDEIAQVFNGMNKAARNSGNNKTVVKINNYYKKRLVVKMFKFMKKRLFSLWKVISHVLTVLVLLLLVLYSFCEFYDCPKHFGSSG